MLEGNIDQIFVWFVHNCPASANVAKEIVAVEHTVHSIVAARYSGQTISVFGEEISSKSLEKLYTDTNTPILVNDLITFESPSGLSF